MVYCARLQPPPDRTQVQAGLQPALLLHELRRLLLRRTRCPKPPSKPKPTRRKRRSSK